MAAERLVRGWWRADRNEIRRLLRASRLCQPVPDDMDVDQLFASYEAVLCDIADIACPRHPSMSWTSDVVVRR